MLYPKEFFELQLCFARHIAQLTDRPWIEAVFEHTSIPTRLKVNIKAADSCGPVWQAYAQGFEQSDDPIGWTYDFFKRHQQVLQPKENPNPTFGCFSYVYPHNKSPAARLHFSNRDPKGSLERSRKNARREELIQLVTHIKTHHPDAQLVRGGSWLYNKKAYCRLFPPAYIATIKQIDFEPGFMSLWGQFLQDGNRVHARRMDQFLNDLATCESVEASYDCFPYKILGPECPIEEFYHFYGV